jgi:hypothetical protein
VENVPTVVTETHVNHGGFFAFQSVAEKRGF